MPKLRIGIRLKLLFLSLFLFAIPYLGYQYVWEMETYLRTGQEETMVGTARAIATALHERPTLFDNRAAYLSTVESGKDLYAPHIIDPIQLDGRISDWVDYQDLAFSYGADQLLNQPDDYSEDNLSFRHMVGRHRDLLYAMFDVRDDVVIYRPSNTLRVDRNDHLTVALIDQDGVFRRYIIAPREEGWVSAYLMDENPESNRAIEPENRIQGYWRQTDEGYQVELRFPLSMLDGDIAFAIVDVDDRRETLPEIVIGTADPGQSDSLGTILVPSSRIEQILSGLKYANSRVWVVDKHMRVLARSGDIQTATGIRTGVRQSDTDSWWGKIENDWLLPLYYRVLTRPPKDFVDELKDAYALRGSDIQTALDGEPASLWRITSDSKAVILSAAHPIYVDEKVMGAVVVEQTTNGIRTLRNRALERLFHVILAVMTVGTLGLFLFASRMSTRIRRLRDDTESAIDGHGRLVKQISPSQRNDEIGDLSRSFHNVLSKLGQYNAYLENMASRLSHELRTPVAVVNSSLDNLAMHSPEPAQEEYIERARKGIKRLSNILTNMSEATRLEQAFQTHEPEDFVLNDVLSGCLGGYRQTYTSRQFELDDSTKSIKISGSPELFAQMLDKIITNAVDFSTPGSTIRVAMSKKGSEHKLTISNKGPLLPEDMQHQLMESMVSIRPSASEDTTHLGLGLYVAKIIADYHGGKLTIENLADDSGVCVTFALSI